MGSETGRTTTIERRTGFTPARIVALLVMGLLVIGLLYLWLSPEDSVEVPAGGQAGDLTLEPCTYRGYVADCGTLVVPENRADLGSRLIALPVTRVRAATSDPGLPVLRLEGGPGVTNLTFPSVGLLADSHDVVLVGYRGVEGSSVLDCPEVTSALKRSGDVLDEATQRRQGEAFAVCAERLVDDGVDLDGYTLADRVQDLEAARIALGYDRINLVSESVGTRTALVYSWMYPDNLHRSVMVAVNPPGWFLWDGEVTDGQFDYYAELCARDSGCSRRTDDLAHSMREASNDMPSRWLFLPIKEGSVRVGSMFGLHDTTAEKEPLSAPMVLDSWLNVANGDASGFWFISFMGDLTFPEAFVWGDMASVGMIDVEVAKEYYAAGGDQGSILGNAGTDFIWAGGRLTTAWPDSPNDDEYSEVRASEVETLLVSGTVDFSTPAEAATDLLPFLPNGQQVILAEFGHSADFWDFQPEAARRLLNTFYETGEVDDSVYTYQTMDFEKSITHSALAWGFVGTMIGFAILMLLSLWWMPFRVRRRGGFSPVGGALMRSLYPIVMGFGGWFLALLIVMTIFPLMFIGSLVLAVFPIGLPIGIGIYWAWVRRDWPSGIKRTGFWGSMAGGLVGAWFGFISATGLLALITSIIGAAVGANLALVALDITRERSSRARAANVA
jgi:pimeloyl-ACP methyl ester carboxylesterase